MSSHHRSVDNGYTTLIGLFQGKSDLPVSLKAETLFGAVTHYLTTVPLVHLTPFTHAITTSPNLWTNPSTRTERLEGFQASVRTAFNVKYNAESAAAVDAFFPQSTVKQAVRAWVDAIVNGVTSQRHDAEVRLVLISGLLQGLNDINRPTFDNIREPIEGEAVVCCAELMERLEPKIKDWVEEVQRTLPSQPKDAMRSMTLMRIATAINLLSMEKIILLDLEAIAILGLNSLSDTLDGGNFLQDVPSTLSKDAEGRMTFQSSRVQDVIARPTFLSFGSISRLIASCITGLSYQKSTQPSAWNVMARVCSEMEALSGRIETDWTRSELSQVIDEQDLATSSISQATEIWNILKTFLFSTVLISQSILATLTFEAVPRGDDSRFMSTTQLVSSIVNTFFHLAFVTSKFGGGLTSSGGGFPEQKRAFFTALDIMASDGHQTAALITRLHTHITTTQLPEMHPVRQAHASFFLACAEQLMPVLTEMVVENMVLPIAAPFLNDPSQRETYESAHSVVLSVFSNHAKLKDSEEGGSEVVAGDATQTRIAQRLAPFYADCLLRNAEEGRLSIEQLILAYSSLVNGARVVDVALTQLCVEKLLDALSVARKSDTPPTGGSHRLDFVLISLISAVGAPLLGSLLREITQVILGEDDPIVREKLGLAAFQQVMEKVADAEKTVAMHWWLELRRDLKAIDARAAAEESEIGSDADEVKVDNSSDPTPSV
ncbi:hypothetical protein FRB93_007662 [Tulasnella sp. JGI-2019a]|nr:hypothetical protein FRB93_007662 [Tulasnella sp. JGI-2019a]